MYGFSYGVERGASERMTLDEEIEILKAQEAGLQFPAFNADVAWSLGCRMRELALLAPKPVAIGIWMAGTMLFYAGTRGVTASNEDWLRRKRNTVMRLGKSTLLVGTELAKAESTLEAKQAMPATDYVAHGGGFPVLLRDSGCVGAIIVSGLTQREDHALILTALSESLRVTVPTLV